MKIIVIMGLTASGKTTIGRLLAKSLHYHFIDIDEQIAERVAMSVRCFYEKYGKKTFQDIEKDTLKNCLEKIVFSEKSIVISVGGGLLENINALFVLKEYSNIQIFFLYNKPKILFNRVLKKAKKEHSLPAFLKKTQSKNFRCQIQYAKMRFISICKNRMKLLNKNNFIKVKTKGMNVKKVMRMIKKML